MLLLAWLTLFGSDPLFEQHSLASPIITAIGVGAIVVTIDPRTNVWIPAAYGVIVAAAFLLPLLLLGRVRGSATPAALMEITLVTVAVGVLCMAGALATSWAFHRNLSRARCSFGGFRKSLAPQERRMLGYLGVFATAVSTFWSLVAKLLAGSSR